MKIRDSDAVQEAIDNVAPLLCVEYESDNRILLDDDFTLEQLKAIVAAIESVPGTSI